MLYLVISNPQPQAPSTVRGRQAEFWNWFEPLIAQGVVRDAYARLGRGLVAIIDVPAPETLHALLNQWAEFVPASFEVQALLPRDHQARLVREAAARQAGPEGHESVVGLGDNGALTHCL